MAENYSFFFIVAISFCLGHINLWFLGLGTETELCSCGIGFLVFQPLSLGWIILPSSQALQFIGSTHGNLMDKNRE